MFYRKKNLDSFIIFNNLSGNMLQIFSLKNTERLSFYYCIYKKKSTIRTNRVWFYFAKNYSSLPASKKITTYCYK